MPGIFSPTGCAQIQAQTVLSAAIARLQDASAPVKIPLSIFLMNYPAASGRGIFEIATAFGLANAVKQSQHCIRRKRRGIQP